MADLDDLDSALRLFTSHSDDPELHFRHIAALQKLCKGGHTSGFPVRDLPRLTDVLSCTLDLLVGQYFQIFLDPTCDLIRAIGRPYVKQSSTDELRLLTIMSDLLKTLARVFTQQLPWQLQACTAEVLEDFASVWGNRPSAPAPSSQSIAELDLQSVQRIYHTHQTILQASGIVPALCSALAHALQACQQSPPDQQTTPLQEPALQQQNGAANALQPAVAAGGCIAAGSPIPALVSLLLELSFSPHLCGQLLEAQVLLLLAQLLQQEAAGGMSSMLATEVTQMLWNLFDLAPESADAAGAINTSTSSSDAVQQEDQSVDQQQQQPTQIDQLHGSCVAHQLVLALASALQQQVETCSSLQRQQQCNDTLTVLCLLSQCSSFREALVSNGSLMEQLLAAACDPAGYAQGFSVLATAVASASGPSSGATPSSSNSATLEADHSMQLLAWTILGNVAAGCAPALDAFVQGGLLQLLLDTVAYGTAGTSSGSNAAWLARLSPEQLSASKQLASSILQQVGPCCRASFVACGGLTVLLDSICAASSSGTSKGAASWLSTTTATLPASPGRKGASKGLGGTSSSSSSSSGGGSTAASCSGVEHVLRLLRLLLRGDAGMASAALEHGTVPALLQMLQAPAAASLTAVRQGVLLCLSEVCSAAGRAGMTAVRQAEGVGLLHKECQSILDGDPYVPSLAALDALWRCCVGSNRSRTLLLAADGMDTILGLLQRGNPALRPVLLSLLADLLSDKRSHAFFWEWHAPAAAGGSGWSSSSSSFSIPRARPPSGNGAAASGALHAGLADAARPPSTGKGRTSRASISTEQAGSWLLACAGSQSGSNSSVNPAIVRAAQLLISIWRVQDEALGVTGPDGVIANPGRPLAGCSGVNPAAAGAGCRHGALRASSAGGTVEAYGLMLPGRQQVLERIAAAGSPHSLMEKVYACFAALSVAGSKDASGVSAEGMAALQQLPAADLATLAVIQQYTAFRQGEVWQDIQAGFAAEGLQVTQEDSKRLDSGIRHAELVAEQVQAAQATLLGAASAQQLAFERVVYDNMAAQAAADARAKIYEKDCSKLTMRERLAAKARKEDMLRKSCAVGQQAETESPLVD